MKEENNAIQLYPADKFKIAIDYLSKKTFDSNLASGETVKTELLDSRKGNITSKVTITNESKDAVSLGEFDFAVLDACISEIDKGNEYTTAAIIFHKLGGGHVLYPQMQKAILDSLERLAKVRILIESEDAVKKNIVKSGKSGKANFRGYLLPTESLEVTINGQTVDAIHFLNKGIIYGNADRRNQIKTCDNVLLSPSVRATQRSIAINHFLLRRTLEIKGSTKTAKTNKRVKPLRHTILLDSLYNACLDENANFRAQQQARQTVEKILDYFIEKELIKSYSFEKDKFGKVRAIILDF